MIYDTDILIECCRNNAKAKKLIKGDKRRSISAITWLEVIRGAKKRSLHDTKEFLDTFNVIPVSYKIGIKAMALMEKSVRLDKPMDMPDSIIAATTLAQKIRLCSKNFGHYRDVIPGKVTPFYD